VRTSKRAGSVSTREAKVEAVVVVMKVLGKRDERVEVGRG
jgi:hypothetical protein